MILMLSPKVVFFFFSGPFAFPLRDKEAGRVKSYFPLSFFLQIQLVARRASREGECVGITSLHWFHFVNE